MERDRIPFGKLLREFRVAARLSQEALAERARLSAGGISVLERGTRRAPHRDTVSLLAAGLELSPTDRARLEAAAVQPREPQWRDKGDAVDGRLNHNLPFALTSFIGRQRESAHLCQLLAEHRLVTLCGVGGIGKTRLALETAHEIVERFPDGVWLVELAPLTDPTAVAARIAATLGVPQRLDATGNDAWIGEFNEKCLLLVLDNCEHVLASCASIAQNLLQRCPQLRILATSREPLRIGGERIARLDSLELPPLRKGHLPSLEALRASPAIQLFFDRARDVAPRFSIDDGAERTMHAVHAVCTRLDAMPLAIELAAAHMNAMSVETLESALDRRFHLLASGARTALPRHQTLRSLIDWSYDLLTNAEQHVLRRLSVFAGGCTVPAAKFVCSMHDVVPIENVLAILSSLVDKSLVVADTSTVDSRYAMLESTRAYALERLTENGEDASARRAHAEYFRDFLSAANANVAKCSLPAWLEPLEPELDNFRAALQWALVDEHDVALGAVIAAEQNAVTYPLSLFAEANVWCRKALTLLGPAPAPALEMPLQFGLAQTYLSGGYAASAIAPALRAAELCRILGSDTRIGQSRAGNDILVISLAFAAFSLAIVRRYDEADRIATEAVTVARAEDACAPLPWALVVKSLTVSYDDAAVRKALIAEALALASPGRESVEFVGLALIGASLADFDGGEFKHAQTYARDAVAHFRRNSAFGHHAAWALSLSAVAAFAAGNLEAAYADACEALAHVYRVSRSRMSGALQVVASGAALDGYARTAAHLMGGSDAMFAELGRPRLRSVQLLYDRTLAQLRDSVPDSDLAAWMAEGEAWSFEDTVAAALRVASASKSAR